MHVELYLGDDNGRNYNLHRLECVEKQNLETCSGQRLTTATMASVAAVEEFLAVARERETKREYVCVCVLYILYTPQLTQNDYSFE